MYFNISLYMYNIYLNISNGSFIYHWQYYIYVCNNQIYPRLIHTQIMTRGLACARIYMLMLVHKYVLEVVTRKSSLYSLYYIIVAALLCFISTFFLYCFCVEAVWNYYQCDFTFCILEGKENSNYILRL